MMAGLEDIVAASSSICDVNGKEGRLIYQGYDIHDLAEHSTFEEVVYLLMFGRLPNKAELDKLSKEIRSNESLPPELVKAMKAFPKQPAPMEILRTAVSMLSFYDPDATKDSRKANISKAIRLIAKMPTIIAYWDNIRTGKEPREPKEDLSIAANFLYLLKGSM